MNNNFFIFKKKLKYEKLKINEVQWRFLNVITIHILIINADDVEVQSVKT